MKLTTENNSVDWIDLKPNEYARIQHKQKDWGLVFKCPQCGQPIGINTGTSPDGPKKNGILISRRSQPHHQFYIKKDGIGCGWHGYLTNGELVK